MAQPAKSPDRGERGEGVMTAMSPEAFLHWESLSPFRHEYRAGEVWAMSGASARHGATTSDLHVLLATHLRARGCRVYQSDLKVSVQLPEGPAFYYPDLVVVCPPAPPDAMVVETPSILIEVFSPSTEKTDRERKWADYARIPSLQAYVLVNPEWPSILVRRRTSEGWRTEALGPDDVLHLESIGLACAMSELYGGEGG